MPDAFIGLEGDGLLATLPEPSRLALMHAPAALRGAHVAFLALDQVLFRTVAQPREAALTQLRLAWWRDQLSKPATGKGAPHPALAAVEASIGLPFDAGIALVDAWENFAVGDDALAGARAVGAARGRGLHGIAGGDAEAVVSAATCWTFVDIAPLAAAGPARDQLHASARAMPRQRLPRSQRPLAILAGLARRAARRGQDGLLGDRLSPLAAIRLGIFGR